MTTNQVNFKNQQATPQNRISARFCRFSRMARWGGLIGNGRAWAEVGMLAIFFALAVGQRAPDVNESHYLCKAKHFWDQSYCPGDIFLASSFSHLAFYLSTGWITQWVSLPVYAWIGRILTWFFLAAGWRAICHQLFALPWGTVVTGVLFLVLNERLHLAGEWVVGGFEAKGIAYGFVLFAIAQMQQRNWKMVWPLLGGASAFHVLVGGWSTIAVAGYLIYSFFWGGAQSRGESMRLWQVLRVQSPPLLLGLMIGLVGILPPLLAESFSANKATANAVYVNERVAHHVNFGAFSTTAVGRFVVLILLWRFLNRQFLNARFFRGESSDPILCERFTMLNVFTTVTLCFSLSGLLLSGMSEQGGDCARIASGFLRFYLFRLADFSVPATSALLAGSLLARLFVTGRGLRPLACGVVFIGCVLGSGAFMVVENQSDGRPNADIRSLLSDPLDAERTDRIYRNWRKACEWISSNTQPDALFITPDQQQTFKWYAGRAEVCCWKDVPQDPDRMALWRERIRLIVEPQRESDLGIFVYSDDQILHLANRFGATHLMTRQQSAELLSQPTRFRQVYPEDPALRTTFVVFELTPIVSEEH